jgi:uncharacterized protein with FMN-binding domain
MSRVVPAVIATLLGLVALATFKSSPGLPKSSSAASSKRSGVVATGPPTPRTTTTRPPTTSPPTTQRPSPTGGTRTTRPPATSPATTTPPTVANTVRTIDGDPIDNPYGTVQVELTLQGTQITNVVALQLPTDRRHSAELSQQAGPILQQEVLQAQSAQIDIVSGATYTSDSYAQSVQSALAKA